MTDETVQVMADAQIENARSEAAEALGRANHAEETGDIERAARLRQEAAESLLTATREASAVGFRQEDGTVRVPLFMEEAREE